MKRVVIGFFLSLLFLLTAGYTQVYAQSLNERAFFATKQIVTHNLPARDKFLHASDASAIEEEDDDNTSSKRYLDYIEPSPAQYFDQYSVQRLPFKYSGFEFMTPGAYYIHLASKSPTVQYFVSCVDILNLTTSQ